MTTRTRIALLTVAAAPILSLLVHPIQNSALATEPVGSWASNVWEAAREGDARTLEQMLDTAPMDEVAPPYAEHFADALERLRTNREQAAATREEERAEALEELRTALGDDNRNEALRQAVNFQTLSADYDDVFENEEIMSLVSWAEQRIPEVERDRDWLEAQDLLYLLRTFYDETDRRDAYERFDEELEAVNERVSLIARYAPRRLHEMRNQRAERLDEEPLGEYNPANTIDWRERLDDIDAGIVRHALTKSAHEHIESSGWKPLLVGGLDALRILATTPALSEAFPNLSDAAKVSRWVRHIENELSWISGSDENELRRGDMLDVVDNLIRLNRSTLELPDAVILREFGDGAMSDLDTYSEIIWPDKLRRFQQATRGNFVGVGILIRYNDKREIMVVNPLEGTPAYFAGVKPNDLILEVNGESTVGWSLNDAVDRITGPKGTTVTIGVEREGEESVIEIPITRDVIKIRTVKGWWKDDLDESGEPIWSWYIDPVSRIAYVRLTQFTEDSYEDLRRAWSQISRDGEPNGLILDLRHNPGGLLTSAVRVANLFLPGRSSIVTGEDKDGHRVWGQRARPGQNEWSGVPTVVLINKGSASASEIVAGCLQAHGAAVVVGERSFGKGSVQTVHPVGGQALLKLTTQYYRLPSTDGGLTPGRLVHKRPGAEVWGVDPDLEVSMSAKQVIKAINIRQAAEMIPLDDEGRIDPDDPEREDVDQLLTEGIDPQLETALLILQARALADHDIQHASRATSGEEEPVLER
jgi:carboxyl-terminal processing protease